MTSSPANSPAATDPRRHTPTAQDPASPAGVPSSLPSPLLRRRTPIGAERSTGCTPDPAPCTRAPQPPTRAASRAALRGPRRPRRPPAGAPRPPGRPRWCPPASARARCPCASSSRTPAHHRQASSAPHARSRRAHPAQQPPARTPACPPGSTAPPSCRHSAGPARPRAGRHQAIYRST